MIISHNCLHVFVFEVVCAHVEKNKKHKQHLRMHNATHAIDQTHKQLWELKMHTSVHVLILKVVCAHVQTNKNTNGTCTCIMISMSCLCPYSPSTYALWTYMYYLCLTKKKNVHSIHFSYLKFIMQSMSLLLHFHHSHHIKYSSFLWHDG